MSTGTRPLLIELSTEELPPRALKQLSEGFAQRLVAGLKSRDFLDPKSEAIAYATPRRLAVAISDVRAMTAAGTMPLTAVSAAALAAP